MLRLMKVSEIFESIEGEGIRVGLPVTFIRLFGCNLRCSYCDSLYSCEGNDYIEMAIEDILEKVKELGHKNITLTGGEPLIHKDVKFLIAALLADNYKINIETNGAADISPYIKKKNLIVTVDYKCPSSGMESLMMESNFSSLRDKDVIKFVVGTEEDLEASKEVIHKFNLLGNCNIFISPVFGKIDPKRIVEFILENNLDEVRVQLQIHKFIWDPNERGV